MPYLEPAHVLKRFSSFARDEIRPALSDDERFVSAQVGSMASTLQYLASELEGHDDATESQRDALVDALDAAEAALEDADASEAAHALDSVGNWRSRIAETDVAARGRDVEDELLLAADETLAAIDEMTEETAKSARKPLYGFLDARLDEQLRLLGRSDE